MKHEHDHNGGITDQLQQRYLEIQMIDQQMRQVQEHVEQVEAQIAEFQRLLINFEDFKAIKPGTEILVPISSGIFAKAELKDNTNFIVNVGSDVTVTKSVEDTKKLIIQQTEELTKYGEQLSEQFELLARKVQQIDKEINT